MARPPSIEGIPGPLTVAKKASGWLLAMSVVFIILGIFAIAEPGIAALAVALLVGWLLILGGVAHLVSAFSGGGASRFIWRVLVGLVYLVGGLYFLMNPALGVGTLTLFLAGIILAEGVIEVLAYFKLRGEAASGWMLLNAAVTLLLGGLIWFHWPSSSVWAIGTLVGVNLLMTGISRLMLGMAARSLLRKAAP